MGEPVDISVPPQQLEATLAGEAPPRPLKRCGMCLLQICEVAVRTVDSEDG